MSHESPPPDVVWLVVGMLGCAEPEPPPAVSATHSPGGGHDAPGEQAAEAPSLERVLAEECGPEHGEPLPPMPDDPDEAEPCRHEIVARLVVDVEDQDGDDMHEVALVKLFRGYESRSRVFSDEIEHRAGPNACRNESFFDSVGGVISHCPFVGVADAVVVDGRTCCFNHAYDIGVARFPRVVRDIPQIGRPRAGGRSAAERRPCLCVRLSAGEQKQGAQDQNSRHAEQCIRRRRATGGRADSSEQRR